MIDFVVIGGGIAGASAAANLASRGSVLLLEMEPTLAYHTTGRSAAVFVVHYGGHAAGPLAKASRRFLESPPDGLADSPLLGDRGVLWVGETEEQIERLRGIARAGQEADDGSRMVSVDEITELVPVMRGDRLAGGLYVPQARDIDVAALHQAFVRLARRHHAEIRTSSPVVEIRRHRSHWEVVTDGETIPCIAVVNAAGAWGDHVASMAGVEPIGLQPMRRTAFMVPGSGDSAHWPMVVDAEERYYFKPDGGQFLCSLAEEIPSEPTDPKPRMEDVALAIERINSATTLDIRTVNSQWTGLRTFAPDRAMVIGESPATPGFFWLVGQGGTGIQTSPGYGELLSALVTDTPLPHHLVEAGVDPSLTDPTRLRV